MMKAKVSKRAILTLRMLRAACGASASATAAKTAGSDT